LEAYEAVVRLLLEMGADEEESCGLWQSPLSLAPRSPSPDDAYHFIPIESSRHIRTVHLQPASSLIAPLRCTISSVCLDNGFEEVGLKYTALSYSWDDQRPSRSIDVDGRTLCVTPNCQAAMRQLRNRTEVVILWIDSICINQNPEAIEERNQQVALMGDVYKCAKKVVIWLGERDAATDQAMSIVTDIVGDSRAQYASRGSQVLKYNSSEQSIIP
jgi:hypothetical protein